MLDTIRAKRDEIYAIARKHKAEKLWVFGSCARKEDTPDSDVDLLVKFGKGVTLFDIGGLNSQLCEMFGRDVDVVVDTAMKGNSNNSEAIGGSNAPPKYDIIQENHGREN